MNTLTRYDVLKLDIKERLKLVEDIWDSIAECPESVVLTDAQKEELDKRFDDYQRNPESGSPWSEVREKIQGRSR